MRRDGPFRLARASHEAALGGADEMAVSDSACRRNIFVVGLDDFHLAQLQTLPDAENYAFRALFTRQQLKSAEGFPVRELLEDGRRQLLEFAGHVDAVVGYWDFPVSTTLPILRQAVGLPGPALEAVLKCEHKYWSRLEQARAAPEHVANFCAVDPFTEDPLSQVTIGFPFWLKPVKGVLSHLGFRIEDAEDFRHAITRTRAGVRRFGDPFNLILEFAELPGEVAAVDGNHCIAESLISAGRQCTLEGYAYEGRVQIYGAVDSQREGAAGSSFTSYEYPSTLPDPVQQRMMEITSRVMHQIDYEGGPFNIEFYWEEDTDHIWLLEINARISKSHAPLFHMVDGCYHHQVMIDLGLGRDPKMPRGDGPFRFAAKFMVRRYDDARVNRVPRRSEIDAIEASIPGVVIDIAVREGELLSQLPYQDSYSYEVAVIFVGGQDRADAKRKYEHVMDRLPLEFARADEPMRPAAS